MARSEDSRAARVEEHLAKTVHLAQVGAMKTARPAQIESLFARHPALCGFAVRSGDDGAGLYVGDVGILPSLGRDQFGEILQEIVAALAELLAEEPGAGEALRGRTFARVLH